MQRGEPRHWPLGLRFTAGRSGGLRYELRRVWGSARSEASCVDVCSRNGRGTRYSMPDPIEDSKVWSPEEIDAVRRDVEEEDEAGAPEKVAWPKTDDGHALESADALREPPYERGEDVTGPDLATPDLEERVQDTP